jgi:hypothetical protein
MSPAERHGWPSASEGHHLSPSTAARPGCWYRTCISGRAPSGSGAWSSWTRTGPDELDRYHDGVEIIYTLTREQPAGWTGYARRVDRALLAEAVWPAGKNPLAFVCGPTDFVETVAGGLVALGYEPGRVKTERFGGMGGQ